MKPLCLLLLSLLLTGAHAQDVVLTNLSVIALYDAKVSRSLISQNINSGRNAFDLSTNGLVTLRQAGIPESLIEEMHQVGSTRPTRSNEDVITLYGSGFSLRLLTLIIQSSPGRYNLTPTGIIGLKTAKIPDRIINAMMEVGAAKATPTSLEKYPPVASTRPLLSGPSVPSLAEFPEPGLYYETSRADPSRYEQLESTTTNQTKSGTFAGALINHRLGGVAGRSQRVGLANPTSNFVVEGKRPVFYFVFGSARKDLDQVVENTFGGVSSPNEFVLIKARTDGQRRQIIIGRTNSYTTESGVNEGSVPFRFQKLGTGFYRVYFEKDVAPGEYVWFYNKSSESASSIKVFDFSLRGGGMKR